MLIYLIQFLVFAFWGWVIDSIYCSLEKKKMIISGYFRGVPLCPIYGFGGILLINSSYLFYGLDFWMMVLVTTLMITTLEYLGGYFAEHYLGEKLWDYSKEPLNIKGYVSIYHSFLWFIGIGIFYKYLALGVIEMIMRINNYLLIPIPLEVVCLGAVVVWGLYLTLHNKKIRLATLGK